MSGAYCKRHEEYSHTGVCRWCPTVYEKLASMAAPTTPALIAAMQAALITTTTNIVLTCGKDGFPQDAFDAKTKVQSFNWPYCKCQTFLSADDCPWYENGVRHSPSGCA